ncbi:MAG TPA: DHHA1 domain-containing protein, partial [Candidatus Thermoplasmatota archaeon]|nr:DHHA1 domain-containing protein [Candidatus Thermoplasmatota archaeon]
QLAREADADAGVALVGAVGDLQDADAGRLVGWNRTVLAAGAAAGSVAPGTDVRYFGRETRPLYKLLQYADDPPVPGASGREAACCDLLANLKIDFRHAHAEGAAEEWRRWTHLTRDERSRVLTAVAKDLLVKGYGHKAVRRLVGEVYVLPAETPGTPVRDAKEFATLLNSTARYGEWEVGLAVARGDRGEAYERALELLQGHRQNLVEGIRVAQEHGLVEREHLQWFHAHDAVRETIVGIVAGMLYGKDGVRRDLPIVAFANDGTEKVKVSGRAHRALVEAGVNLAEMMREAAAAVGGAGGGHAPAAGATIPKGAEEEFLKAADRVVARQLGR